MIERRHHDEPVWRERAGASRICADTGAGGNCGIAALMLLGPTIGQVFSSVVTNLQPRGVVTSVSADRTGGSSGNDVVVTITVSTNTTVDVSDSQDASPVTNVPCNVSCTVTLLGVGFNAGTVMVTAAAGGTATASYDPKS